MYAQCSKISYTNTVIQDPPTLRKVVAVNLRRADVRMNMDYVGVHISAETFTNLILQTVLAVLVTKVFNVNLLWPTSSSGQ